MKIQYHLGERDFEGKSFHLQSLPQFLFTQVSPYFCDRSVPFFFFPPPFPFTFLGPMFSPCHIVSCYTSSPYMVPMAFCSSVPCSVLHLILLGQSIQASFLAQFPEEPLLLLAAFELHLHVPPLLPVWLLLSHQPSSSSCLVLAKGGGWSLDREVPFSAQSPVQA